QDAQVIPSIAKVCVVPSWVTISYPELSTAFCRFSTEKVGSSYSILNFSVARFTEACVTPRTFFAAFSTVCAQDAQVIPSMSNDLFSNFFSTYSPLLCKWQSHCPSAH